MVKFPKGKGSAFLMAAIPLVFFTIGIFLTQMDHKPEVVALAERVRPGYETAPATYSVEASPHKKWADYVSSYWFLVTLGYLVAVGTSFFYVVHIQQSAKPGSFGPLLIAWVVGAALIWGVYVATHGSVQYATELSVEEYNVWKDNLDAPFPIKR